MKIATVRRAGRAGFTLIELLVVIAIIAVLASLIAAAVLKFLLQGPVVETRAEIVNLSAAIEKFKTDASAYPPSRILLREDCKYNPNSTDQLELDSITFLTRFLGRAFVIGQPIDWNGDGAISSGTKWVLEGDECLVFFLQGPKGQGFPVAGNKVYGPYFTFQPGRIQSSNRAASGHSFKNYLDPFGNPYAYFSAWTGPNQYDIYSAANSTLASNPNDCHTLGVLPYLSGTQYYNPSSYQIISAGTDKTFGPGGSWTPANAQAVGAHGMDDMTNFYQFLMGVPQS